MNMDSGNLSSWWALGEDVLQHFPSLRLHVLVPHQPWRRLSLLICRHLNKNTIILHIDFSYSIDYAPLSCISRPIKSVSYDKQVSSRWLSSGLNIVCGTADMALYVSAVMETTTVQVPTHPARLCNPFTQPELNSALAFVSLGMRF